MKTSLFALALSAAAVTSFSGLASADPKPVQLKDGEDLNVHNNTGHEVVVFLFNDDGDHKDESGGTQFAHLKDKESAVAHAPHCKFGIMLVDHDDVWFAEVHDCHSTDLTFTKDTGHAKKPHH